MRHFERISTGVEELDNALGGGFYRGSIVLLAGNPGTGKTTLASQFLYSGLIRGEKCVYLSFVEDLEGYLFHMKNIGLDFEPYIRSGRYIFIPASTMATEEAAEDVIERLIDLICEDDIKRVVVDSLSAILRVIPPEKTRSLVHNGIIKALKSLGATGILVEDLPHGTKALGPEEFLADTVIILRTEISRRLSRRIMEIRKTRFFAIDKAVFEYAITDRGIRIYIPLIHEMKGSYSSERLPTGVGGLDEMLGGLYKGSSTLVFGPSGSGKTYISTQAAIENASLGRGVLYISFNEPREQVLNLMRSVAGAGGVERIEVYSISPYLYTLSSIYFRIIKLVEEKKPDLVVLDGLASLRKVFGDEYLVFSKKVIAYLKARGITVLLTDISSSIQENELSDAVDTAIMISLDVVGERVRRRIAVLKNRGGWHDDRVRELVFSKEGVVIK